MKSKKGFTLIELLAIIVILAIIAVITVPIILNIIENSRKGAATDSAYGYKDAVNKWYVERLSENHNFNLSSSYTVTNGNLGNEQIPFSGDKPTSGYLNYSNNVLTDGCLVFGDYAVTFTNGEVSSTVKGECTAQVQETVLYYTYDSSATADPLLGTQNSTKLPEPDASWKYYIKETKQFGVNSYAIQANIGGTLFLIAYFDTGTECTNTLSAASEELSGMSAECVEFDYRLIYEACGIEGGKEFCLKDHDLLNSRSTLDVAFPGCVDLGDEWSRCVSLSLDAYAAPVGNGGFVEVGDVDGEGGVCSVASGLGGCKARPQL